MEARLPITKLNYLQEVLLNWETHSPCSLKELQEIISYLQFCIGGTNNGCTFIRSLINFSMRFHQNLARGNLPAYMHTDIHMVAVIHAGMEWHSNPGSAEDLPCMYITDASSLKGLGGTLGDKWFLTQCPCQFRNKTYNSKRYMWSSKLFYNGG